jgi:phenylalanyl-tRNA synthetase beta chain
MLGLEVESQHSALPNLRDVIVARVAACENHPRADRLKVCTVDTRDARLTVVCGAPNVAPRQLVAFAPIGTTLPNGLRIEKRNIRGIDSHGMICSEAELGLSNEADGILILDGKSKVGEGLDTALEADTIFEVNVTPNRPDCLGIIGIAREIAAYSRKPLRVPKPRYRAGGAANSPVKIIIKNARACPRYAARLIEAVKIGPSPEWMAKRLQAVGIRPISNIVDVTNYVMQETGQPLHAFDFANLQGQRIIVRLAEPGERFQTLDGKLHELQKDDLLICDGARPVAIAGVMGGLNSEVSESTQNVLLECAYFEPLGIRKTAKRLSINSEAARRFERGIDPNGIPYAIDRATELLLTVAGGKISGRKFIDVYPRKIKPVTVAFRPLRAQQLIGKAIRESDMQSIFNRLQFKVSQPNKEWRVVAPTFRPDLTREIDLIEEVARVYGFDHIEPRLRSTISLQRRRHHIEAVTDKLRNLFTGMGLYEAVTISLLAPHQADVFLPEGAQRLMVRNPFSEELSTLRSSILATLLISAAYNLNRKTNNFGLFEVGSAFWKEKSGKIIETRRIGAVLSGDIIQQSWRDKGQAVAPADLRGLLDMVSDRLRTPAIEFHEVERSSVIESGWHLRMAGKPLGIAGKLNRSCLSTYDISAELHAVELDIDTLLRNINWTIKAKAIPRFPAVERDISIVVDDAIPVGRISELLRRAGSDCLESFALFDMYSGQQVSAGKKSLTYALRFRAVDRTLRENEVDAWQADILRHLQQEIGATLRT